MGLISMCELLGDLYEERENYLESFYDKQSMLSNATECTRPRLLQECGNTRAAIDVLNSVCFWVGNHINTTTKELAQMKEVPRDLCQGMKEV